MINQKKCFLIYNSGIDISPVRQILINQMIETIDQYGFSSDNDLFNVSIREKIKSCNFTIAIISEFTSNISFEIGVSIGLQKPTLVILIKENIKVPDEFITVQIIRSPLNDIDLLTLSIKKFLTELQKGKSKIENKKLKTVEDSDVFQKKLLQIEHIRAKGNEKALMIFLEDFFNTDLAVEKVRTSTKKEDLGIDFTLWDYDPSFNLTKPIPVEIKLGNLKQENLLNSEQQLKRIINQYNGNFGFLLYLDRKGKRFNKNYSLSPFIVRMDISDFINKIKGKTLWNFILEQRNNIAHMRV